MSPTRIVFSLALVLLLAGYAIYSSPGGYAHAWLSGACFRKYAPLVCHPQLHRRYGAPLAGFDERTDAFTPHRWAPGKP